MVFQRMIAFLIFASISLLVMPSELFAQMSTRAVAQLSTGTVAQLQIDPSSALLLNPSSGSAGRLSDRATGESRSESTRYTSRPRATSERPANERIEKKSTSSSSLPLSSPQAAPQTSTQAGAPIVLTPGDSGSVVVPVAPSVDVVASGDHAPEPMTSTDRHFLEISIATAYLYENADSNYSFRRTTMGGPAYTADARAWLTHEFGAGGRFFSTLGGHVSDGAAAVSASRTETSYGIYFRKVFATSNLVFGAEYVDSEFKVLSDAVSKVKTKSGGVRVSIDSEFQSNDTSWTLGFSAMPKIQHEEISAATEVRSGTGVNAYVIGASFGRKWKYNSSNAAFIRLEHRLERDLFTGSATRVDPTSSTAPNGVAATVGTTLIQFGYSWGD